MFWLIRVIEILKIMESTKHNKGANFISNTNA